MDFLAKTVSRTLPIMLVLPLSALDTVAVAQDALLTNFSLEQLLDVEVTSVSKKKQRLDTTASAIYVITQEDIKNSGITNIPDILKLAPGINVDRIDSNKWAVTARGFNGRFANKLLVLMDGRTLYSPAFSGTYWETQDLLLSNIERIEIIRGSGATIWGANAVNGVINIITKDSVETQGVEVAGGGGTLINRFASARWGTKIADNTTARINVKGTKYDNFKAAGNENAKDDWSLVNSGFRLDHQIATGNVMTLSGDGFRGNINQKIDIARVAAPFNETIVDPVFHSGYNLNYNWLVDQGASGQYELSAYYDFTRRKDELTDHSIRIFDLDMVARRKFADIHDLQLGVGFRHVGDKFSETETISFAPAELSGREANAFIQDEIEVISDKLYVTLGTKFEKTRFTKLNMQPSGRAVYKSDHGTIWGAVSRALRTPSRIEQDATVLSQVVLPPLSPPMKINILGDSAFKAEGIIAYELGYRNDYRNVSLDVSTFYNRYNNLRSFERSVTFDGSFINVDNIYSNSVKARTYGVEIASKWHINDKSSVQMSYTHQETEIGWKQANEATSNTDAPRDIVSLFSSNDLSRNFNATLWMTYQSKTKFYSVINPSISSVDPKINAHLTLTYRFSPDVEVQLVGRNLLEDKHIEYLQETYTHATYVPRSVFAKVTWKF